MGDAQEGSASELTAFRPLTPDPDDERKSIVSDIFGRFFSKRKDESPQKQAQATDSQRSSGSSSRSSASPQPSSANNNVSTETSRKAQLQNNSNAQRLLTNASSEKLRSPYSRTLGTVTQRINSILTGSSNNHGHLKDYNQSSFRQYWMPDSRGKECYECQEKFTTFRRRHHCRICGQIFCSRCCNQEIPGKLLGYFGGLRLCTYCCKAVLQFLDSPEGKRALLKKGSGADDLETLKDSLLRNFGDASDHYATETDTAAFSKKSVSVYESGQWSSVGVSKSSMSINADCSSPRLRSRKLSAVMKTFSGGNNSNSIDDIFEAPTLQHQVSSRKAQSVQVSVVNNADESHPTVIVTQSSEFNQEDQDFEEDLEPEWVRSIKIVKCDADRDDTVPDSASSASVFLANSAPTNAPPSVPGNSRHPSLSKVRERSLSLSYGYADVLGKQHLYEEPPPEDAARAPKLGPVPTRSPSAGSLVASSVTLPTLPRIAASKASSSLKVLSIADSIMSVASELDEDFASASFFESDRLNQSFETKAQEMLWYLLYREKLRPEWFSVLWPISRQLAFTVTPNHQQRDDSMDILSYVHVKTLQHRTVPNANVVFGTVCTKAVADLRMPSSRNHPRILLIGSPVEYERVTGKFCSLDPVIAQEHDYLRGVVAKIVSFKPQIVIVPSSVARIAQDMLLKARITVICNMKPAALARIQRCTEADLVASIDGQIALPKLGNCGSFRTETMTLLNGTKKTLMYFEGCSPQLYCSVVLGGERKEELSAAKLIIKYMIRWLYSAKLEIEMLKIRHVFLHDIRTGSQLSGRKQRTRRTSGGEDSMQSRESLVTTPFDDLPFNSNCAICRNINDLLPQNNNYHMVVAEDFEGIGSIGMRLGDVLLNVTLMISPIVYTCLPFLETEVGKRSPLLPFFKGKLFIFNEDAIPLSCCSSEGYDLASKSNSAMDGDLREPEACSKSRKVGQCNTTSLSVPFSLLTTKDILHPFVNATITLPASDVTVKRNLAQYRAHSASLFRKRLENKSLMRTKTKNANYQDDEENRMDVLNPYAHQRLAILYSSYCDKSPNAPGFCTRPWIIIMEHYGFRDICLGKYLQEYCFKPDIKCPNESCDVNLLSHCRRFVHGVSCVELEVEVIKEVNDSTNGGPMSSAFDEILTWDWCWSCKTTTTPNTVTTEMWHLSFARYLEYLFLGRYSKSRLLTGDCDDCLFHSHWQYFALNNIVACFKVSSITVLDLSLPSQTCKVREFTVSTNDVLGEMDELSGMADRIFSAMTDQINRAKLLSEDSILGRPGQLIADLSDLQETSQRQFAELIEGVKDSVINLDTTISSTNPELSAAQEAFIRCRHILESAVQKWNFVHKQKPVVTGDDKLKEKETQAGSLQQQSSLVDTTTTNVSDFSTANASESFRFINVGDGYDDISIGQQLVTTSTPQHSVVSSASNMSTPVSDDNDTVSLCVSSCSQGEKHITTVTSTPNLRRSEDSSSTIGSVAGRTSIASVQNLVLNPIASPFQPYEHYALPLNASIAVAVTELQVSSIIAYSLTTKDYEEKLAGVRDFFVQQGLDLSLKHSSLRSSSACLMDTETSAAGKTLGASAPISSLLSSVEWSNRSGQHVEVQFSDPPTKFYSKIYFAEHFRMLRKLLSPQGEEDYIQSISHCTTWQPRGGKSGVSFFKTTDDRFVLKQMSRFEMQSFFKFAANYFHFIANCHTEKKLTALAKIFGVYRIVFKNHTTGLASKVDILVMENLFYRRNVCQVFDLKGSMRNRLVQENGELATEDLVLLDENLLRKNCTDPIYVHPHAKTALKIAILSDSKFLANNMIMDYSLLVGVDEDRKELVIGIIDYVRTYTWDKRLETFVKTVTVSGSLPTVVSPELYSTRFTEAMDAYFLAAPDRWTAIERVRTVS